FLSLLLNNPGSIDIIFETISPEDFDSKELSRLYAAMARQYSNTGMVDTGTLISGVRDSDFVSLISRLASRDWPPEELGSSMNKALNTIKRDRRKRIRDRLREKLAAAEAAGDQEQADQLLREIRSYGLDADTY
ncbi:MAG: DnaB-like helicase N-terminal domain-containing protein, partial [candidate division Zixibacteria bacterium]|nr:DnaB-like helicase N-terminal domain-containing protein [candidate division Zixibacteria bacterium]